MGNGPDIPWVFKTGGKVRNKNVTKRQTEMLVKEIWKVRMAHRKAGKAGVDLVEMIFLHLQKTKGLHQAVIEVGTTRSLTHMHRHCLTDRLLAFVETQLAILTLKLSAVVLWALA